ncbi:MAG: tetratricopeptide repeat protein [Planctomycetes bacterium]|nr:tetratricopeptide repeat protein [Planctomycetota bacterium]
MAAAIAISIAVLAGALRGEFVYDDLSLIVQNPSLRSLDGLFASFRGPYWDFARPDGEQLTAYWRPLASTALFAAMRVGDGAPWVFHALSLLLHAACIALVFQLARHFFERPLPAFAAALIFGLHPVQVESTAWIAAANDPLAALGVLAAAVSFVGWRKRGSPGLPLVSAFAFFLGLLAKESAAAWLLLAPALDLALTASPDAPKPRLCAYGTFVAAFALYFGARCWAYGSVTGGLELASAHLELTPLREVTLRIEMLGGFLGLLFAPHELNLFRDVRPVIASFDRELLIAAGWSAAWLVAVVLAWRAHARAVLAGLLWLVAALAPLFFDVESLGRCAISERFAYIAVAGIALLFGAAIARARPTALAVIAVLAIGGLASWKSRERVPFWRDEETLFTRAAEASPKSPYVYWGLGRVLLTRFRSTLEADALDRALQAFSHSQDLGGPAEKGKRDESVLVTLDDRLQANVGYAWCILLCEIYMQSECWGDEAEPLFRAIADRFPNSAEAYTGLGIALAQKGDIAAGIVELERATRVNAKSREAWFNRGYLLARSGRVEEAVESLARAHEIDPTDRETARELSRAFADAGRSGEANQLLATLRETAPSDPNVWIVSSVVAAGERRLIDALAYIDRALQLDGTIGDAHLQKAKILYELSLLDRALPAFGRACELMPSSFEAHYQCGRVLFALGAKKEALPYFERAIQLAPDGKFVEELRPKIEEAKAAQ